MTSSALQHEIVAGKAVSGSRKGIVDAIGVRQMEWVGIVSL
jgi:hypothetical protein